MIAVFKGYPFKNGIMSEENIKENIIYTQDLLLVIGYLALITRYFNDRKRHMNENYCIPTILKRILMTKLSNGHTRPTPNHAMEP
jgi:hypothetical protein